MRAILVETVSDEELVQRFCARGDENACEQLVARHWTSAYRLALRLLGDPAAAEDAAQEAFVALLRGARSFRTGREFGPWFRTLVLNAARQQARSKRRRARHEGSASRAPVLEPAEPADPELARAVDACFRELPFDVRSLLALHYHEGCSYEEVARVLDLPRSTAQSRIERGVEQLPAAPVRGGAVASVAGVASVVACLGPSRAPVPAAPEVASLAKAASRVALGSTAALVAVALTGAVTLGVAFLPAKLAPSGARPSASSGAEVSSPHGALATATSAAKTSEAASERAAAPRGALAAAEEPRADSTHATSAETTAIVSTRIFTSYTGRLVDDRHAPIAGAPLQLEWHIPGKVTTGVCMGTLDTTRTGLDGRFAFHDLKGEIPASAQLILRAGWCVDRLVVDSPPLHGITNGELAKGDVAARRETMRRVSVVVRADGAPRRGVTLVSISLDNSMDKRQPDANGRVDFVVEPGSVGPLSVTVNALGDGIFTKVLPSDDSDVSLELDVAREPRVGIEGRVVGPDGHPVVGAPVTLEGRVAVPSVTGAVQSTDEQGRYHFDGLPAGESYFVNVAAPGLVEARVHAAAPAERLDVMLRKGGAVRAEVPGIDAESVMGWRLLRTDGDALGQRVRSEHSQRDGAVFTFDALEPGTYVLVVAGTDWMAVSNPLVVRDGEPPVPAVLTKSPIREVKGRVVDTRGVPVRVEIGARVHGALLVDRVHTGSDGEFEHEVPDEDFELVVDPRSDAPTSVLVPRGVTTIPDVVVPVAVREPEPEPDATRTSELAAIGALKTIGTSEAIFREGDKDKNGHLDYGTLEQLKDAQLIDSVLGSGKKQGYVFECKPSPDEPHYLWYATARPEDPRSGGRQFFVNQQGVIFYSAKTPFVVDARTCRTPKGLYPVGK